MAFTFHSPAERLTYPAPSPHAAPHGRRLLSCREVAVGMAHPPARRGGTALRGDSMALALTSALTRLTPALARAAAAFKQQRAWLELGFARLDDLTRERFGRSGRWLRDLATLAEAFDRLPALAAALSGDDGCRALGCAAALQIARVATDDSLAEWLALARRMPVRRLREAVGRSLAEGSRWPLRCDTETEAESPADATWAPRAGATAHAPDLDAESGILIGTHCLRVRMPAAMRGAFGITLHLYRAVQGYAASVSSFVEALLAEATAGPVPVELAPASPAGGGASRETLELLLARATGSWSHLPESAGDAWAFALARESLQRFRQLEAVAGSGDPAELEAQIRALVDLEDEFQRRLGALLAEMGDGGAWSHLRFAGLGHYAEERLGLSRTTARDRVSAARALRRLPVIRDAYETGAIGLEATMRIVRAVGQDPVDEQAQRAWVTHAREITIKRLREEIRAQSWQRAGVPGVVEAEAGAAPAPLTDAQWQASLRFEPGMTRARLAELGRLAAASPTPDDFLQLRLPESLVESLLASMDSRCRDLAGAGRSPLDAGERGSLQAARTFSARGEGIPAWVGLLSLLEEFVETWDPPAAAHRRRGDRIYSRDGWRCTTPACTSRRNLEMHHIRHRSQGGPDEGWNLTTDCRMHH